MNNDDTPSGPQRVEKTGLALVHEGEWIFAQQGSAAPLTALGATVVNYYFPVVIEVIGGGRQAIVEQICDELRMHFEAIV
jgi:hypothetical protein